MTGMTDYVRKNLRRFNEEPLNEVDSAVFAWLSYLHFPAELPLHPGEAGIELRELWKTEYFDAMTDNVVEPEKTLCLLGACAASPRFRSVRLSGFRDKLEPESDQQFAAVTFEPAPGVHYLAYRGTDSTLTGWKEDLLLGLAEPIPAQKLAVSYLEETAGSTEGTLLVGGHSKGGNLAVYASALCSGAVRERIAAVYSHDGPGFRKEDLDDAGFEAIHGRIHKTIPQSSLIGLIFEQECEPEIVESSEKSLQQHCVLTWRTEGSAFVRREKLTPDAELLYRKINGWNAALSGEERVRLANCIFDILETTGASDFHEFHANLNANLPILYKAVTEMEPEDRKFMLRMLNVLITSRLAEEECEDSGKKAFLQEQLQKIGLLKEAEEKK